MFKLNKFKGFTLIEVICSLSIFAIIFAYIMNFQLRDIRLSKYNDEMNRAIEFVEALKNNIIYKWEYEEIRHIYYSLLNGDLKEKLYINKDNINIEELENKEIKDIVSKHCYSPMFIEFQVRGIDENVIKISLRFNVNSDIGKEVIETQVYKGDY